MLVGMAPHAAPQAPPPCVGWRARRAGPPRRAQLLPGRRPVGGPDRSGARDRPAGGDRAGPGLVPRSAERRVPQHPVARRAVHRDRAVAGDALLRAHPAGRRAGAARRPPRDVAARRPQPRSEDQRAGAPRGDLGDAGHLRGVAHDGGARRRRDAPGAARRQARAGADRQPRRAAGGLPRSRPGRRAPARVRRHPGRPRSQGGEGQGGDPEAGRAQPGRADRERRDQLSPLGELPVGRGRARRPGRGRRVDARRRGAPRGALRAGAQPRPVDPLLHAQRPRRGRRPRLDGELQLRRAGRRRDALARGARRRRRLHRHRPVRGPGPDPGSSGRPVGDATRDLARPRAPRSARACRDAASRCCPTAGASARRAGTCRPATSRCR